MAPASRAAQKRELHDRFRRDRKNFYVKRKIRQLRLHDGGGKDHNKRAVWYTVCPCRYNDGLHGRRVTAEMAQKIESKLRRGL